MLIGFMLISVPLHEYQLIGCNVLVIFLIYDGCTLSYCMLARRGIILNEL